MFFAAVILLLFAWNQFDGSSPYSVALSIPLYAAIAAGILLAGSLVAYFFTPHRFLYKSGIAVYLWLVATVGILIIESGGFQSPYIASWLVVSIFAAFFDWAGFVAVLGVVNIYLIWGIVTGTITTDMLPGAVLAGEMPAIIGFLLWGKKSTGNEETTEDKTYHELATQLSQVSGKSDVVLNVIEDGVLALNAKGNIELINPAAQRMIGWGDKDALGLSYTSVLKLVDNKNDAVTEANDPVAKVLNDNQSISTELFHMVTSSGKTPLISLVISPVGQLGDGIIVVFRDITNEKAEEQQQAEFISTASHEMRTPVASIEGYLGLALNPATATIDAKARDFITKAHESAQHLGRLFQDLLDVTKADDGRLQNNPKVVDMVPFVHDIAQGLRPKAEEKQLHFVFRPIPDDSEQSDRPAERNLSPVFYVNVDNDHLREVLGNLIENAIKYTPAGDVVVDITGDDKRVVFSVSDTGIGIPREDQAHLFQKFYRVDNSDTREIGGTGLGLYLSRRLTESMGGRIWVESEYKKGSTFFVELPRISHEDATALIEKASVEAENSAATIRAVPQNSFTDIPTPEAPVAQPLPSTPSATSIASTTVPAPTPSVAPQPSPSPTVATLPPATPTYPPRAAPLSAPRTNTPLSEIEANPHRYLGQRQTPPR
ncbi:MAG: ATP-binding protein [Candidatus Saccharimonas sp.]